MANMTWTSEQRQAIDTRGRNVLVAAAAGSGKTAVLVERVKNMVIDEGIPLAEILVVTFTEAAASEMKQKIETALNEVLNQSDAPERRIATAREQLQKISSANINTFHGFAMSIIKEYFYAIELDPSFKVVPAQRNKLLRDEVMDELFAERFESEDQRFIEFLKDYSSAKSEWTPKGMVSKVYDFVMSLPDPFDWLEISVGNLEEAKTAFICSQAFEDTQREIEMRVKLNCDKIRRLGQLISDSGFANIADKNRQDVSLLESLLTLIKRCRAGEVCFDELIPAFRGIKGRFTTFAAKKEEKENGWDDLKDVCKRRRDAVKKDLEDIEQKYFKKTIAEYANEIAETSENARYLQDLVVRYHEMFAAKKRGLGFIDFTDMEHMALEILRDEKVSDEYRRRLKYIFIDEYQDSNYLQETIIERVSKGDNVYMVGDVKQSIYRFRRAEPDLFLGKFNCFPGSEANLDNSSNVKNQRIDLNKNFRSKAGILDAVNMLFARLMDEHYSGMKYDKDSMLYLGTDILSADGRKTEEWSTRPEIHIVSPKTNEAAAGERDAELPADAENTEAVAASEIIGGLIGLKRFDAKAGKETEITYKDIVILLRSDGKDGESFRKTLETRGIPAFTDKGKGFFDTVEIEIFLKLLAVVDNFRQDVPLAATMYSVCFGWTTEELANVRTIDVSGNFYRAVIKYEESGENESLRAKCTILRAKLENWRNYEHFMRLDEFIWYLLNESGIYAYAGALRGGMQRQANLKALLKLAAEFQNDRLRGLGSFLSYIEAIKKNVKTPQVSLTGEGDDAVKIMSIHKSKGLEFPVVILCQLGRKFGGGRADNKVLLHKNIGLAVEWQNHEAHTYKSTLMQTMIRDKNKIEDRAEELRLLYVAMTRPIDRLYMIGEKPDPECYLAETGAVPLERNEQIDIMASDNYLDMIMPAVLESPQISVKAYVAADTDERVCDLRQRGDKETQAEADEACKIDIEKALCEAPADDLDVSGKFEWQYPYVSEQGVKAKYSVTSLVKDKGRDNAHCLTPSQPRSLREDAGTSQNAAPSDESHFYVEGSKDELIHDAGLFGQGAPTAAERGTVLHKILELLDFSLAYDYRDDKNYFADFVAKLGERYVLSAEQARYIDICDLLKFANSPICEWAKTAVQVKKEVPFNMKMRYEGKDIVVQGIVDCILITESKVYIIDYKSGYFRENDSEDEMRITERYGEQVRLYAKAIATVLDRQIDAGFIYMMRTGSLIKVC